MDLQEAFDAGFDAVKAYVDDALSGFERRIIAVEARSPAVGQAGRDGEKGDRGQPGSDGAPGPTGRGVAKLLIDAKGHLIVTFTDGSTDDAGLVVGRDGKDGVDGRDGRDGLDGKPGEKGADGVNGRDGADGKDGARGECGADGAVGKDGVNGRDGSDGKSVDPAVVADMVRAQIEQMDISSIVKAAVDLLPKPVNGRDGKDGAPGEKGDPGADGNPGRDGVDGRDGENGEDGKDGVGLADAVIDRDGNLVLTMTDGRHKSLGGVIGPRGANGADGANGRDGVDGTNGVDGLGFDDLDLVYDGERAISIRFQKGDRVKEFPVVLPIVIDRGVWQERGHAGGGYEKGDGVSWGGQFYIARKATFDKPDNFEAWRLSVKKGRDAKDPVRLSDGSGNR